MSLIKFKNRSRLFPSWSNDTFDRLMKVDDIFNSDFFEENSLMPAMNVIEHKDDFEIEFAAPGFSKKDFVVTIEDNILHVNGEKKNEVEEKDENFTCREFSYNSFKRSLSLPQSVNLDQKVKATYKNGILKINLLKKEEVKKHTEKVVEVL
jgi:HSP20 family protein